MRAVGNALPDYARYDPANQNNYIQSQQLEYPNQGHPPFPSQPLNMYQTQQQGHYNIDFGRNHLHNMTSPGVNNHSSHVGAFSQQHYIQRPSYLQIPSIHSYVSQQEPQYQQNMPQQVQRPNIYPSHPSQYFSSGRNSSQSECSRKSIETTLIILSRSEFIKITITNKFFYTRSTTKTTSIRSCSLGWQSSTGNTDSRLERPLFSKCHRRYRVCIFDIQVKLRIRQLQNRRKLYIGYESLS